MEIQVRHLALMCGSLATLYAQTPAQIQKELALGDALARDFERLNERINDPAISEYLQRIGNRLALAGGVKPLEIRTVRNSKPIAAAFPNGVLFIGSGFLEELKSEAELAGLIGHQVAHLPWQPITTGQLPGTIPLFLSPCVLSSPANLLWPRGWTDQAREREQQATAKAVNTLKAAGYDPEAVLTLFSKLSYEHPAWAKAIVSDDLLDLRATLEDDIPPANGYLVDGSQFLEMQARLASIVGPEAKKMTAPSLTK
jgi:hypothetical protein